MHILQSLCIAVFLSLFRHNKPPKFFCLTFGVHVIAGFSPFSLFSGYHTHPNNYGQKAAVFSSNKTALQVKILQISEDLGGERYTKRFNVWIHLIVMLYAVIKRFDSLREITTSLLADTHKLAHIGITFKIGRSTLADANKRRPEAIFEAIYRDLYSLYRHELISEKPTLQASQMDGQAPDH